MYLKNSELEDSHYFYCIYLNIMDILVSGYGAIDSKIIRLISDDVRELDFPLKLLSEGKTTFVIDMSEPFAVDSSLVEIKCQQVDVGKIFDDIQHLLEVSRTTFVILKDSEALHSREIEACLLRVFKKLWEQRMTNIAVIFSGCYKMSCRSCKTLSKVFIYVYEPYREEPLKEVTEMSYSQIFYDKTANLHLHPLRVLAFESERFFFDTEEGISKPNGIDGSLTELIGEIYNASIILSHGSKRDFWNLNAESIIKAIETETFDLWLNVGVITNRLMEKITFSYPRERMDVACIVPKYRNKHIEYKFSGNGRVFFSIFLIVTTFSALSFFMYLGNKVLKRNIPLFKLAKLMLNQSNTVTQKTLSITMQVLFITWMISSFMFSTWFLTLITSVSIRPSRNVVMTTIQQVLESDLKLRIGRVFWKMTHSEFDKWIYNAIGSHLDIVNDDELFNVNSLDIGYITSKDTVELISKAKHNIYVLPESFFPNLVSYYFSKNSPFNLRLDKALSSLTETGILEKWVRDNQDQVIKGLKAIEPFSVINNCITCEYFAFVMYMYGTGMTLAILVFLSEFYFIKLFNLVTSRFL